MKTKTSCLAAMMGLAAGIAWAQGQKAEPPQSPKPGTDGPSLEVTMKFIQDKLNDVGPINYVAHAHDNVSGNDWSNQFRVDINQVASMPNACRIHYHATYSRNGQVQLDQFFLLNLKTAQTVIVKSRAQVIQEVDAASGHSFYSERVDPLVFDLELKTADNTYNDFFFKDEELANRVAKAVVHALDLCGGGEKNEPF